MFDSLPAGGTRAWCVTQHRHSSLLWLILSSIQALSWALLPKLSDQQCRKGYFKINYSHVLPQTQMFVDAVLVWMLQKD